MDLKTYISAERGRASTLAAQIDVSASYLSQMASGLSPISPERCVLLERATGGLVTRKELRPADWQRIWPELEVRFDRRATDISSEEK
jgi:DNA-binding transcriptional regulator YdaS (Cro superfamily)